jgi:hypothetical protein
MANSMTAGVAYADPQLHSLTVTNGSTLNTVTATSVTTSGTVAVANAVAGLYFLSTAITPNVTTTTAPKGSIGTTSNNSGAGYMFISDGTKWQIAIATAV